MGLKQAKPLKGLHPCQLISSPQSVTWYEPSGWFATVQQCMVLCPSGGWGMSGGLNRPCCSTMHITCTLRCYSLFIITRRPHLKVLQVP